MSRFSTGLHKVWAVNMTFKFSNLESNYSISDTYGTAGVKNRDPWGNVPFSHRRSRSFIFSLLGLFIRRKVGIAAPLLISLLSIAQGAWAQPLSLEQLIARTQEMYEKTSDLKAGFIQEVTIKSMKRTEREEGTVYFKNPRMMLWDYHKPKAKKLVINAQKAWLYVPEDRMVYVQNSEDVYRSRMAVKFLSGIGRLAEDFQIRFSKESPHDSEGNYHLVLTAKEAGNGVDRLYITIDGRIFQILKCRFNDAMGNTTRLRFSDFTMNLGIPDRHFTFKAPEGVEVVQMP
jgi:outer membrane lipoprotein carrier protein